MKKQKVLGRCAYCKKPIYRGMIRMSGKKYHGHCHSRMGGLYTWAK